MITYLIRRILNAIPILIGVNLLTFVLFFIVNTPDDMARMHLGDRYVTQADIHSWKRSHGYDKPLLYNADQSGIHALTETLFFQKSLRLFAFDFGLSDEGRQISLDIKARMWPSLALALPTQVLGLFLNLLVAILMVSLRHTRLDQWLVGLCTVGMSISLLFFIIIGQYIFARVLKWLPISGYQNGIDAWRFLIMPVLLGVFSGLGAGARWYRTLLLEQLNQSYVRTARSKGLSDWQTLRKHVLPNALLPILTGIVAMIPLLFMGSLVLESFFAIPGLGNYVIEAIGQQDFAIVRAMVFLGTVLYLVGLILTDLAYSWADPRVELS